jgi:hypothetical protein
MRDGLDVATGNYIDEALASFSSQGDTHVALLVVALLAGALFMVLLFRPFLAATAKESRRVAELLTQLPKDMDVEGMVAASWKMVLQVTTLFGTGCSAAAAAGAGASGTCGCDSGLRVTAIASSHNLRRLAAARCPPAGLRPPLTLMCGLLLAQPAGPPSTQQLALSTLRLQAKLAAEEAASRHASTTFKAAAKGIMAQLRSSLDLSSYSRVHQISQRGCSEEGGGHDSGGGGVPRGSMGRLPLLAGATDAVVMLARSSRVRPTPRGWAGEANSTEVPAINMELVQALRASGAAGSPRAFSPRQSTEMSRRSARVSAEVGRLGSVEQGQGQGVRWSGEYEQAGGNSRRESNRVSLQQVRPLVDGPAGGSPGRARFSQTYIQEAAQPRQQASGRAAAGSSPRGSLDYGAAGAEAARRRGGAGAGGRQPGARFSQQLDGLV